MRRTLLICLSLAAVTWAALWPVSGNGFVNFDDPFYISENGSVLGGLNWPSVKWAFSTGYFGNWHPLTWLSHMLDVQLFGLDAGMHHLHSLALHTGSVLLLFLALQRMTKAVRPSAFAAALFAVHPLRVESVAWAAERKDVLSVFFGMLSLWAYVRYVEARKNNAECGIEESAPGAMVSGTRTTDHGPRTPHHVSRFTSHASIFYLLSLAFFALALMSKAMLVTLPCVLLLLDYWPLGRMKKGECRMKNAGPGTRFPAPRRGSRWSSPFILHPSSFILLEKAPFFILGIASAVSGFLLLRHAGAITEASTFSVWDRVAYTAYGYLGHLRILVFPVNLVFPYPRPAQVPAKVILLAAVLIVLVSCWALALLRRRPYVAVGWFWFLGCLVPVSGLLRLGPQALADRYTYFPSIGLFIAVTWGVADIARNRRWRQAAVGLLAAVVLTACVLASRRQAQYWHDSERLYRHDLAVNSENCVAHNGLGYELFRQGKVDEAIRECQAAVRIDPRYDPGYSNLGRFFAEKKDYASAIAQLETALRLSPHDTKPRNNLGNVLYIQGRYAEAKEHFTEVLRFDPGHTDALNNLGLTCQKLGQPGEAIPCFRKAIKLRPGFTAALNNLAWLLATSPDAQYRNGNEAVRLATEACELNRFANPNTLATLAAAYAETGQMSEAIGLAEQAQERAGVGSSQLKDQLASMIEAFRAGRAYRAK
jgi:tetratricopeptide (TPR) repeat protein